MDQAVMFGLKILHLGLLPVNLGCISITLYLQEQANASISTPTELCLLAKTWKLMRLTYFKRTSNVVPLLVMQRTYRKCQKPTARLSYQ